MVLGPTCNYHLSHCAHLKTSTVVLPVPLRPSSRMLQGGRGTISMMRISASLTLRGEQEWMWVGMWVKMRIWCRFVKGKST